ncbi:histone acetyltransferase HPA2 [Vibrio sp. JCM 19236]|nr:histone acetyltransferase HPA2 [Vibrio sp. JCM 19236]
MTFEPITQDEWPQIFAIYKQALFEHVEAVFGWDEAFQKQRLVQEYDQKWFHWVYHGRDRVGLICFKPTKHAIHLHLLILLPDYQGQGLGKGVMQLIERLALESHKTCVTLSSFTRNQVAIHFYQKLGYLQIEQDSDFISMQKLILD